MDLKEAPTRNRLLAMAAVAMAVLLYEIAITRLLSVVLWYHFAFLSISVAMLGLGVSGVWFSFRRPTPKALPRALLVAGVCVPLSVCAIVKARPAILEAGLGLPGWIATVILSMLVPMCALGAAVCLLLISAEGRSVGRMYAADLLGATVGAASVIPLMEWIPTPTLLALVGLLPLASLALLAGPRKPAWLVCAAAVVAAAFWGAPFQVGYSKIYAEEGATKPLYEVWTPTVRITLFDRPIFSPIVDMPWGWGYGSKFQPKPTKERWIDQDGAAGSPIENLRSKPEELTHLFFDVTSIGYQLVSPRTACIIGAGGGRDVLTALASGARQVDAVEINGAIVALLRGPLAAYSGDLYRLPGVNPAVSEGRSYLSKTKKRYDLIQISLVDSWAATVAGAYSLSENYLYTVEALRLYLHRLNRRGVVSISRFTDAFQPFEGARLILLANEALRQEGVASPRDHLLFVSGGAVGTLIVGKEPLDQEAIRKVDRIAEERGFRRQWPVRADDPRLSMVSLAMRQGAKSFAKLGIDLEPPVDDRPFFFQAVRLFRHNADTVKRTSKDVNLYSVSILRFVLILLGIITLILFFLPFAFLKRPSRTPGFWAATAYFSLIGVAFMLLEIPWIQKSILFLGHPSYATAVVLACLLLGAGVGSATASRVSLSAFRRLLIALPCVAAVVTLLLGPVFRNALLYPLPLRALIAAFFFSGSGFFTGLALPLGFIIFGERHKAWFWAVNGACSVLASALSIALAMTFGFVATSLAGVACYTVAALLMASIRPNPTDLP